MKKQNFTHHEITGVITLIFIFLIPILSFISPDIYFSESENRVLQQKPKFTFKHFIDGQLEKNYEKYICDQIISRNIWIGIKSDCERLLCKKDNNNVYLGKNGYLLEMFEKPDEKTIKSRLDAVNSFAKSTPDLNKYFMLVPNSVKVLEDNLPYSASPADEVKYINKVKQGLYPEIKFVNIYDILSSKKNEYIYYKTDHHWTTKGAYYGYTALAKSMGYKPQSEESFNIKQVSDDFYGSLYSKSGFKHIEPDKINLYIPKNTANYTVNYYDTNKITKSIYNLDMLKKKDKYSTFLDNNHSLIKISIDNGTNDKLIIAKDSYANCLIPFLLNHFSEIYVVDLRYYTDDIKELIKKNNIHNMLMLYNVKTFFEDASVTGF